jgi:HD superfamily phosphodiesterase
MNIVRIFEFAQKAYQHFDASHDINHAIKVMSNAIHIYKKERCNESENNDSDNNELFMIWFTALLHDVRDHKYIDECISEDEMKCFFIEHLGEENAMKCLHICNNISWSKENKKLNIQLDEKDDWMRKIIQDADWLEAIGQTGLTRCIDYVKHIDGNIPEDVCQHIRDKLLKMTFSTKTAQEMALTLNQPLIDYLSQHA